LAGNPIATDVFIVLARAFRKFSFSSRSLPKSKGFRMRWNQSNFLGLRN
jgi:hypothetical protein